MTEQNQPYIYLSYICREVKCLNKVEKDTAKFNMKFLSMDGEGEVTQYRFTIKDVNLLKIVENTMNEIHKSYPKFRYFLTVEDETDKGNYRVYINKKGKKIVTKAARKRIGFHY